MEYSRRRASQDRRTPAVSLCKELGLMAIQLDYIEYLRGSESWKTSLH